MQDDQDLDYEAAVHLDIPFDEGFYPDWDGTNEDDGFIPIDVETLDFLVKSGHFDEPEDNRSEEEIIFDALTDAGLV